MARVLGSPSPWASSSHSHAPHAHHCAGPGSSSPFHIRLPYCITTTVCDQFFFWRRKRSLGLRGREWWWPGTDAANGVALDAYALCDIGQRRGHSDIPLRMTEPHTTLRARSERSCSLGFGHDGGGLDQLRSRVVEVCSLDICKDIRYLGDVVIQESQNEGSTGRRFFGPGE